jgi:hypothetical protein
MMEFVVKTLHHYATVFILQTGVGLEDYDGGEGKLEGRRKIVAIGRSGRSPRKG